MFEVHIAKRVNDFLQNLSEDQHRRCIEALKRLQDDPFRNRPKCDMKKLSGQEDACRLRVGDYRFIYVVNNSTVIVEKGFKRGRDY